MKKKILIGKLGKSIGVKGEVSFYLEDYNLEDQKKFNYLLIEDNGDIIPYFIENVKPNVNESYQLKLEDVNSKEMVSSKLANKNVFVYEKDLNVCFSIKNEEVIPEKRYFNFELYDQNEKYLGRILNFIDYSGNCLLEIKTEIKDQTVLIPFHDSLIIAMDENKKKIKLEIADGLLDLE